MMIVVGYFIDKIASKSPLLRLLAIEGDTYTLRLVTLSHQ